MRILLIGATGTIGQAVARALPGHEIIAASRRGEPHVDITDPASVRALFARVGRDAPLDAVVSAAGGGAWKPLSELTDEDFAASLRDKLMGQVNVVRYGLDAVRDGGSITVTSGVLAQQPMAGSGAVSLLNAGLEGFVRAAALEAPRGIRVNVVSPGWVSETLAAMGQDPTSGIPADEVATVYVASVTGAASGAVLPALPRD
jgi:NAD(P)-dependent dehydrogenase (short-subunit alcohol dehydrogenase family)